MFSLISHILAEKRAGMTCLGRLGKELLVDGEESPTLVVASHVDQRSMAS